MFSGGRNLNRDSIKDNTLNYMNNITSYFKEVGSFYKNEYLMGMRIITDNYSDKLTKNVLGKIAKIQKIPPKTEDDFDLKYSILNKSARPFENIPYRFRQSVIALVPGDAIKWVVDYRNKTYNLKEKSSEYVYSGVAFSYAVSIPTKMLTGLGIIKAIPYIAAGGKAAIYFAAYLALIENPLRLYLQKKGITTGLLFPYEGIYQVIKMSRLKNGSNNSEDLDDLMNSIVNEQKEKQST